MKTSNKPTDLNSLIGNLQQEDQRNIRITRNFQRLMFIMAPIYLLLFNIGPLDELNFYHRLEGVSFALAFLVFGMMFRKYNKLYKSIDYGLPTLEMLKKAADRYRFHALRFVQVFVPLVLIDLGTIFGALSAKDRWFHDYILYFQFFYWGMVLIAIGIGYVVWRKRQKPLRDAALALIKEMEE